MNYDTIRINWEWLMMLIVHLFCNSSISESIYLHATPFCKNGYFRLKKRHFRFSVPEIAIAMI